MSQASTVHQHNELTHPPMAADNSDARSVYRPSAVLLVARDRSLDDSCRRTLSDAGINVVVSVPNSKRALELLGENQLFDAVVIGIGPGDVDAVMLAQHMRRHRSDTPTVVMSPIGNLEIPGAVIERVPKSNDLQLSSMFQRTLRKAITFRRSMRRRHQA